MTTRRFRKLMKQIRKERTVEGRRNSYHEPRFAQDYHDDQGRLIHAEWDGILWQLQDANTGEFLGIWDKHTLPHQPGELVFPAPFVKMEDRTRE